MFGLSIQELMLVGVVAVLLFGKRLPEVARSFGQSYNQFRKGLQDIQSEMHKVADATESASSGYMAPEPQSDYEDYEAPTAPRFELPSPADETASSSASPASAGSPATGTGDDLSS